MFRQFTFRALITLSIFAAPLGVRAEEPPSPTPSVTPAGIPSGAPARTPERRPGAQSSDAAKGQGLQIRGLPDLRISGTIRAYDLNRVNQPKFQGNNPNREAFNFGGGLRADYSFGKSGFTAGGAFWGAYPFGVNGPPAITKNNRLNNGIDNSLPGFDLETFEYYVKFANKTVNATVGNQLINKLWEPASDSRIKPALYQAFDSTFKTGQFAIGVTRITRFERREQSLFDQGTLLTSATSAPTSGAWRYNVVWTPSKRFTGLAEKNDFLNIASLVYVEGRYQIDPASRFAPYVAAQFAGERQTGRAYLGLIDNQTTGVQIGFTPVKRLQFAAGADYAPWNYATINAASLTAATAAAGRTYFLPGGGTGQYANLSAPPAYATIGQVGPGSYRVAYGGIASPYTDSYATDPLYTTSLTQGVVDRRSAGVSLKGALTYTSANKALVALASEAFYNYDTQFARNRASEFDADVTYNFNRVRSGAYRGLALRERLGIRQQPFFPNSAPGHFTYLRHQLQYTF
ncbi:MAG: hypothetical protein NVSMB5_19040 [Candidatus Velthaea sp.]